MQSIYYCYFEAPVGRLLMLSQDNKLTNLDFELEQIAPNPTWIFDENRPLFIQVKQALARYFAGEPENFVDIPIAPKGTDFQQQVWQALLQIPYGQTFTYGELAQLINHPKAMRAVGGAVGRNPISIIIPCHRILGKNRSLTGFGGGLPTKRHLLQLEHIAYIDKGIEFVKPKLLKKYYQN
ncbi:methylated-DNA--[protein]-cysteine S-methyltransferase [Pasteurella canis]|uniref:methylated-DNA--[protein]-cysteine S-methyltransferase n=1 Tax=Pasteurella canis TaxID=753 RepID=UPI000D9F8A24|nr:methylated-DNA--[protein]-cysteine S-methyltransferase [Pasteurella canis]UAX42293.1 methylated-DNA--[protein]-cysteine S-methyltransferase [Pasteurella canis]SPY33710.1 methylated-DNA--protein-cysteine methyltransferase [Pasteurella canis]